MIETLLEPYYNAGYPAVALETCEERRAVECFLRHWPDKAIYSISASGGLLVERGNKTQDVSLTFPKAFEFMSSKSEAFLLVFDFQHIVSGAGAYRSLLRYLPTIKSRGSMVILISPSWSLPQELRHEIPVIQVSLPTAEELRVPLTTVVDAQPEGEDINFNEIEILSAARGLTLAEAENVFALASNEGFSPFIVEREKMRLIRSACMTVEMPRPIDMLGGLGQLKEYVQREMLPWRDDIQLMVRGLLLVGVQGTGKSLSARVIASILGWPLVRFDMANAKASRVGESESNLRQALAMADAIAPCILWADEVEKSVGGYQSSSVTDGGTTSGMVGMLLTWSQEHTSPVAMIMTCNDYSKLPPELIRPGRILDVTDLTVAGMDMVPGDSLDAAQMRIAVVSLSGGRIFFAPPGSQRR